MKNKLIGLDTNIFIYYFHQHDHFGLPAKKIFTQLANNKIKAVTSVITSIELLSFKRSEKEIVELKDFLLEISNLTISDLTNDIAIEAARIRRDYGFRLPDSVQLATSLSKKATRFLTNDVRLKKFKELEVVLLENF